MSFRKRMSGVFTGLFTGGELAENRKNIVIEQLFAGSANTLSGGTLFTGLLVWLQLSATMIGNISIVTSLGSIFQVFSAILLRRFRRKKNIVILGKGIVYLISIVLIGVVPFLNLSPAISGLVMLILVFLATFISAVINPGMASWHIRSIPEEVRNDYFSFFTVASNIVVFGIAFVAGKIADLFKADGLELTGLTVLRLATVSVCVLDLLWLGKIREYPEESDHSRISLRFLVKPLLDREYRKNIAAGSLWAFSSSIAGPYYNLYLLKDMRVAYSTMALVSMTLVVAMICFIPIWSRRIKRTSYNRTLRLLMRLYPLHYLLLALVTEKTLVLYPVGAIFSYTFYAGIAVIAASLPYVHIASSDQIHYISCYSAMSSLAAILGTGLGTLFITLTADFHAMPFGMPFHNIQLLMVVSAVAMLLCSSPIRNLENGK